MKSGTEIETPESGQVVRWHPAKITLDDGDELPAWVLKQGGRTILTAVSESQIIEPVTKDDRRRIAEALADATKSKEYDRNGFVMKAMQSSKSQHDPRDAKQYVGGNVHSYASHKDVVFIVIATFLLGIAVISIFLGICYEVH